jgi:CHASE2 domain-containing sensor protein/tRNA A-37 threonylcarbamoyl transferase component Bud32
MVILGECVRKLNWQSDWFIGLMIMLMFLVFAETQLFGSLDNKAYNLGARFSTDKEPSKDVVVIAIDDQSLEKLGPWPWSREVLARVTNMLGKVRPRVTGFTMPFDLAQNQASLRSVTTLRKTLKKESKLSPAVNKALNKTELSLRSDEVLADSFKAVGRIVLSMPYIATSEPVAEELQPLPAHMQKFTLPNVSIEADKNTMESGWLGSDMTNVKSLFSPVKVLADQVDAIGVLSSSASFNRMPLIVTYGEDYLASFPLMLATRSKGISMKHIVSRRGEKPMLGGKELMTDADFNIYPRFYEAKDGKPPFKVYSFADVLDQTESISQFRDKIVLIGLTSPRLASFQITPDGNLISQTLAAAHTTSSLLNGELFQLPAWAGWAQSGIIVIIGLYLMFVPGRFRVITSLFMSLFLLFMIFNTHFVLMSLKSIWIPMMTAAVMLVIGHLALGMRHYVQNSLRDVVRQLSDANKALGQSLHTQGHFDQAFEKFSSCQVNKSLLRQIYNLGLDYERKRQFNKASSAFKFIKTHDPNYNDVTDRIQQNENASNRVVLSGASNSSPNADLITDFNGIEKPKLGRYEIDKEIGRGAMGKVYLGHDAKIGRTVAIKTMIVSDEIEDDHREDVRERFFREAEAAGRLDHPNIVTVYDVGEDQDLAYIAMDYLKGKDLTAYTSVKTLLPLNRVFKVCMSVALALDYAHKRHVVHRDIKPANIIYDEASNTAKLTDFGVACLTDASKTKTGTVVGSPMYMAPEQLTGSKVDGRADLFSLGVMIYQLIGGELPFNGDSMANLMYNITNETQADIRDIRPELPACVQGLISKALQKDPDDRFQTGNQMAAMIKLCFEQVKEIAA